MRIVKKIGWVLLIALVIAQFFRPDKNDGKLSSVDAFLAETKPSENVSYLLKETCFDCHSDHTRYPWYNNITPVNYWLEDHINHGKGHFNVSEWNSYSVKKKDHKLDELIEMVEAKEMPLNSYTWTHGEAKLTEAQIAEMVAWAKGVRASYDLSKD